MFEFEHAKIHFSENIIYYLTIVLKKVYFCRLKTNTPP